MNPLLVVLPYCNNDYDLAVKLVQWIVDLGSCKPHSLLLAADDSVPREKIVALMNMARPVFHETKTMLISILPMGTTPVQRWLPNEMFTTAARQVRSNYKHAFLWLEPDCVPMRKGWLDEIATAYDACPKRFMGPIIHQEGQAGLPPDHLTGCSVYPNNAIDLIETVESVKNGTSAWDIGSASAVVPKASNTNLIFHFWGTKDMPPVFVENRDADDPKNFVTIDFVRKDAVLFHRSKDGNLIKILRKLAGTPGPVDNHFESIPAAPTTDALSVEIGEEPETVTIKLPAPAKKNK